MQKKKSINPKLEKKSDGTVALEEQVSVEYLKRNRFIILSFFVPFILMGIGFIMAGVYPFGGRQIIVTDLWHQYYPFLSTYQQKLQTGGSLLYSWNSGLGSNYFSIISYYLASPLNFLTVFFPAQYLREAMTLILVMKVGFAGMFTAICFRGLFKKNDISIVAFSTLYALCAFVMGYYWCIIWIDTVALLPLVCLGAVKLLREKKFKLFVVSLALSILTNYLIGLFTCFFVVFCFIGVTVYDYKIEIKEHAKRLARIILFSILSLCITAFLEIPAFLALKVAQSNVDNWIGTDKGIFGNLWDCVTGVGQYNDTMSNMISSLIGFRGPTAVSGLPNIYCGVAAVLFAGAFFVLKNIKLREKIFCGLLLAFMFISMHFKYLDFMWHGFHSTNQLPYRYSFLISFILVIMAFRAFTSIEKSNKFDTILTTIVFAAFIIVVIAIPINSGTLPQINQIFSHLKGLIIGAVIAATAIIGLLIANYVKFRSDSLMRYLFMLLGLNILVFLAYAIYIFKIQMKSLGGGEDLTRIFAVMCTIAIALVMVILLFIYNNKLITKQLLSYLIFALIIGEMLFNTTNGIKTVTVTDRSTYPTSYDQIQVALNTMRDKEKNSKEFYRVDDTTSQTLNDPMLYKYNGLSLFSSTGKLDVLNFTQALGIPTWVLANRTWYEETSPVANAMLGMKYLLVKSDPNNIDATLLDSTHSTLVKTVPANTVGGAQVKLYQLKNTLPLAFMANNKIKDFTINEVTKGTTQQVDKFTLQNDFFKAATGINQNVFTAVPYSANHHSNLQQTTVGYGIYSLYLTQGQTMGTINFEYTMPKDGTLYMYADIGAGPGASNSGTVTVSCTKKNVSHNFNISNPSWAPYVFPAGVFKKGDVVTITSTVTGTQSQSCGVTAKIYASVLNDDVFDLGTAKLKSNAFKTTSFSDTKITGKVDADQDGVLYTSISYEKGWAVYVDGKKVDTLKIADTLLGIPVSKGHHTITMKYLPDGFIPGLTLTLLGILIFAGLCFLRYKNIDLLKVITKRKSSQTEISED
ncbi:MAG: YfhO family protein [Bacillota bacterium]|nr:YfhO family protein [Bacillota bacterium]